MFGLSTGHLLILALVILIFGSRRLPEVGSSLGRGIKAFKDSLEGREATQNTNPNPQVEDQKTRST